MFLFVIWPQNKLYRHFNKVINVWKLNYKSQWWFFLLDFSCVTLVCVYATFYSLSVIDFWLWVFFGFQITFLSWKIFLFRNISNFFLFALVTCTPTFECRGINKWLIEYCYYVFIVVKWISVWIYIIPCMYNQTIYILFYIHICNHHICLQQHLKKSHK